MSEFMYGERLASDALGVSDSLIKKTRRELALQEEVDFGRVPWRGRTVIAYSHDGLEKVFDYLDSEKTADRARLSLSDDEKRKVLQHSLIQAAEVAERLPVVWTFPLMTLVVVRKPMNRRILFCRVSDVDFEKNAAAFESRGVGDGLQRLQVKDHTKFVNGMKVPECELVTGDLWLFSGKLPRFRGRF